MGDVARAPRRWRVRPWALAAALLVAWAVLVLLSLRVGTTVQARGGAGLAGALGWGGTLRGALAALGIGTPLADGAEQAILGLRLWRALVAGGVGASLALAGALLQGLFRNGLASPAVVGVSAGAVLGASLAIALIGGFGPGLALERTGALAPVAVTGFAMCGALASSFFVMGLATTGGRLSVPTLLLSGIAVNTVVAGLLAALQSLTLRDVDVSRAILAWSFGTLDDRSAWQVALVWSALACVLLAVPFVARELDLFVTGEEDAQALGVHVQRVKLLALAGAALATAASVAVAGQIAFVGLVVPHLVRMLAGPSHRRLLPLCCLAGAVFLLGCDLGPRALLPSAGLRPGVTMSLIGGPFFLVLLVRHRRFFASW